MKNKLLMLFATFFVVNISAKDVPPVELFFCDAAMSGGNLSPDGKYFAALVPANGAVCSIESTDDSSGTRVLLVIDLETQTPKLLSGTKGSNRIGSFFWMTNSRIGFSRITNNGGLDGNSLWAVNIDGTKMKELVPGGLEDGYPTGARVLNLLKDDDRHVLVSYNKRRPILDDVYKLNIYSGKLTLVAKDPAIDGQRYTNWMVDKQGTVRGYSSLKGLYTYIYHRNDAESDFKLLRKFKFQEPSFGLSTYSYDPRYLYVSGQAVNKDGSVIDESDTASIWLYDAYEDKFVEKVYQDDRYDVGYIGLSEKTEKPQLIAYAGEKIEYIYLDSEMESIMTSLDATFPNDEVSVDWTENEDKALVYTSSDVNPGEMYLYDRNNGSISFIAKSMPWIDKNKMSPMIPIEFKARDGLLISGYLTVPANSDGKNLPLIVNPHGGPNARDYWGYNPEHQLFASRGYAVLSMNFRGSTGYGRKHLNSANKQWGKKMQDDVTDSVNWAVEQGIANKDKVCIYGASYGGYAVMAGITMTPDLYKCAVNYVGVTSMELLYSKFPKVWEPLMEQQKVQTGDPEKDEELLKSVSPIEMVDRIKTPLYIVHGVRDWRVPIAHAELLKKELVKNGKKEGEDFWWMVKADEGHGFRLEENKAELYNELDKFFASYLN